MPQPRNPIKEGPTGQARPVSVHAIPRNVLDAALADVRRRVGESAPVAPMPSDRESQDKYETAAWESFGRNRTSPFWR